MSNELSDEAMMDAFKTWRSNQNLVMSGEEYANGWRECRCRAEALIEQTFQAGVRKGCEISEVWTDREQVIEAERRKAFEAGFLARLMKNWNSVEAYRVYTEAAKEEKMSELRRTPMNWCGVWEKDNDYIKGDFVYSEGSFYIAKEDYPRGNPVNNSIAWFEII